jgi:hypothetical protein
MKLVCKTALIAAAAFAASAMPAQAQPDEHHQMLDRLSQCRQVQIDAIAHLEAMAHMTRMRPDDVRAHRHILDRLAWCRDSMTAIATHMEGMAHMH